MKDGISEKGPGNMCKGEPGMSFYVRNQQFGICRDVAMWMTSGEQKALATEGTMSTLESTPLSIDTRFEEVLPHATEPQTSCRTLHHS